MSTYLRLIFICLLGLEVSTFATDAPNAPAAHNNNAIMKDKKRSGIRREIDLLRLLSDTLRKPHDPRFTVSLQQAVRKHRDNIKEMLADPAYVIPDETRRKAAEALSALPNELK